MLHVRQCLVPSLDIQGKQEPEMEGAEKGNSQPVEPTLTCQEKYSIQLQSSRSLQPQGMERRSGKDTCSFLCDPVCDQQQQGAAQKDELMRAV